MLRVCDKNVSMVLKPLYLLVTGGMKGITGLLISYNFTYDYIGLKSLYWRIGSGI